MAKTKRPVMQTYRTEDITKGKDPYAGKTYSQLRPEGAPRPTHLVRKVPGRKGFTWEPQMKRWVK